MLHKTNMDETMKNPVVPMVLRLRKVLVLLTGEPGKVFQWFVQLKNTGAELQHELVSVADLRLGF